MSLFPFYEQFSQELSDVDNGNKWYASYCERKNMSEPWNHSLQTPYNFIRMTACPELPQKLAIDGREVSPLQAFNVQIVNNVTAVRTHDENGSKGGQVCPRGHLANQRLDGPLDSFSFFQFDLPGIAFFSSLAAGRWRVIALTNNYSKIDANFLGINAHYLRQYPGVTLESELRFLGWERSAVPPPIRELFDDFVDSSEVGMRCVRLTN